MTIATFSRLLFQMLAGFIFSEFLKIMIVVSSVFQVIAMILFFYSMWGRIRPVDSQIREAKGEKF
jgi:hypothetical protein